MSDKKFNYVTLCIDRYSKSLNPRGVIFTPQEFYKKNIINFLNKNEECFKYALIASLFNQEISYPTYPYLLDVYNVFDFFINSKYII